MDTNINTEVSDTQLVDSQQPIICPLSVHEPEDRQQKISETPSAPEDTNDTAVSDTQVSHQSRCAFGDPKKRSGQNRSRSRSSSKQSKDRCPLDAMSNAAYRFLKEEISDELTKKDLKRLKKISVIDHASHGIPTEQLATVNTAEQFLCSLEKNNLLGEDHLYYIQWLLHKLKKKEAVAAVEEYAKNRSTYPLRLRKCVKRRQSGREHVEFRIIGNFRHAKMSDVNKFRRTVSEKLNIPRRFIWLSGLKKGSIIIVFEMPEVGINRLRQALERKDSWLKENQVLDVHIHQGDFVIIQSENSRGIIDLHTAADKQNQGTNFADNDATGKMSEKSLKRANADVDTGSDGLKKRLTIPKETQKERTGQEHPSGRISQSQSGKCHKVEENPPDSSNDKREQSSDRAGKECLSDTDKCFLEMGKGEGHEIQENPADSNSDKREKSSERCSKECIPDTDKSFLEIGKGECDYGGTLSSADSRRIREEHHSDRPHEEYHQNTDQTFLEIDQDGSIEEIQGTPSDISNERKQNSKRPSKEHVPDTDKSVLEMGIGECDHEGTLSLADSSNVKRQQSSERSSKECLQHTDKSCLEMDKGGCDGGTLSPAHSSKCSRGEQQSERHHYEDCQQDAYQSFLPIDQDECDHGRKLSSSDGIRVSGEQQYERPHEDCQKDIFQYFSNIIQGEWDRGGKLNTADSSNDKRQQSSESSSKECLPDTDKPFLEMGKGKSAWLPVHTAAALAYHPIDTHKLEDREIEVGGFVEVYKAVWKTSGDVHNVAAKRLNKGDTHELEVVASLNHPDIVRLLGEFQLEEVYKSLHYAMTTPTPLEMMQRVARAVDYPYKMKIMYKDMRSANFYVFQGNLKLADFGIAKKTDITAAQRGTCLEMTTQEWTRMRHAIYSECHEVQENPSDSNHDKREQSSERSSKPFLEIGKGEGHEVQENPPDSNSDKRQQSSERSIKECLPGKEKYFLEMGKDECDHGGTLRPTDRGKVRGEQHSERPHEDYQQDSDQDVEDKADRYNKWRQRPRDKTKMADKSDDAYPETIEDHCVDEVKQFQTTSRNLLQCSYYLVTWVMILLGIITAVFVSQLLSSIIMERTGTSGPIDKAHPLYRRTMRPLPKWSDTHMCCGNGTYDSRYQTCCLGRVSNITNGQCCGHNAYDPTQSTCCRLQNILHTTTRLNGSGVNHPDKNQKKDTVKCGYHLIPIEGVEFLQRGSKVSFPYLVGFGTIPNYKQIELTNYLLQLLEGLDIKQIKVVSRLKRSGRFFTCEVSLKNPKEQALFMNKPCIIQVDSAGIPLGDVYFVTGGYHLMCEIPEISIAGFDTGRHQGTSIRESTEKMAMNSQEPLYHPKGHFSQFILICKYESNQISLTLFDMENLFDTDSCPYQCDEHSLCPWGYVDKVDQDCTPLCQDRIPPVILNCKCGSRCESNEILIMCDMAMELVQRVGLTFNRTDHTTLR